MLKEVNKSAMELSTPEIIDLMHEMLNEIMLRIMQNS